MIGCGERDEDLKMIFLVLVWVIENIVELFIEVVNMEGGGVWEKR